MAVRSTLPPYCVIIRADRAALDLYHTGRQWTRNKKVGGTNAPPTEDLYLQDLDITTLSYQKQSTHWQ